ncbi:MAG: hypothetical protein ACJAXB_002469 [Candidatus Endobugula sp.]|jgi:hypothetical protein
MITIFNLSFNYNSNSWTKCITNGAGTIGEIIENNYSGNAYERFYQGKATTLSKCQLGGLINAEGVKLKTYELQLKNDQHHVEWSAVAGGFAYIEGN